VLNLGRKDLLAAHLDLTKLMRLLHGEAVPDGGLRGEDVRAVAAWDWGPMLVAGHLWRELGLEAALDRLAKPGRRDATTLSDRARGFREGNATDPSLRRSVRAAVAPKSPPGLCLCETVSRRELAALTESGSTADLRDRVDNSGERMLQRTHYPSGGKISWTHT
jgi:hypothetical protein